MSDWSAGEGSDRAKRATAHATGQDPIHIKKSHEGEFTAFAKGKGESVQQAARSVLANPNASPKRKKQANFARNAAGWNH